MKKHDINTGDRLYKIFIYVVLGLLAVLILVPVLWVVMASVKETVEHYGNPWALPTHLHWQNFVDAWNKADMGAYMGHSVLVTGLALVILLVVALEMRDPGFTITFDSKGGTDVPAQTQMYGELLEVPEPPSREGYTFTGWYKDHACMEAWNVKEDTIQSELTLYAGWEKIQE